jgi:hypothetical protein
MSFLQICLNVVILTCWAWLITYPWLVPVLSFNDSWNSEGKAFVLLRLELEGVVRIQIYTEPYKNNDGKRYRAIMVSTWY